VGPLSPERLQRVAEFLQRYVDDGVDVSPENDGSQN
jgi:hypothetical protein